MEGFLFLGGIVFVCVLIGWTVKASISLKRKKQAYIDALLKNGFVVNHEMKTATNTVLFDTKAGKIAFVSGDRCKLMTFDSYAGLQWSWKDQRGARTANVLSFTFNDVETPLIKIPCGTADQAEFWLAKVPAIINTSNVA